MEKKCLENISVISTNILVNTIYEGHKNGERFCFILGAGAPVSSNIPSGAELEYTWMQEMSERSGGFPEVRDAAKGLKSRGLIDHDFKEIEEIWEKAVNTGAASLPSEYYFDIYTLRFYPNFRNGYRYLEEKMENAQPSFGYYPLALMLAEAGGSNLVITTNFDSLVEDALLLYTDKTPLVINHELLAEFAGELNNRRPVIAKLHRGIFFDPLNRPEEIKKLGGAWDEVLRKIFQHYTPVIIGYGGGDSSLMGLLEEESVTMKNRLYWCYMDEYGLPGEKIQRIVKEKNGCFVRMAGFDALMFEIGKALFPDKIGEKQTADYVSVRFGTQIRQLETAYDKAMREAKLLQAKEYKRQGRECFDARDYKDSISCYTKALEIQPDSENLYYMRGFAYLRAGKYKEAVADCDRALKLVPDSAAAYNNRGCAYIHIGDTIKAVSDFNQAIKYKPDLANPYKHLGAYWRKQGDLAKAEEYLTKAIERDKKYKAAYQERAKVYSALGEDEKAAADKTAAAGL